MSDPISWQALQAIGAMLEGIAIDEGYFTDLGKAQIFYDRSQQYEEKIADPFIVILADSFSTNERSSGSKTLASDMAISIQYAVPFDLADAELVAHRGRADIVRRLLTDLRGAPNGFTRITVTGSSITDAPAAGSDLVIAQVQARASLSESIVPA